MVNNSIIKLLHHSVFYVSFGIIIVALMYKSKTRTHEMTVRVCAFLITYALVPGIFINSILKAYWGRPRPLQTNIFGGTQDFHKVSFFPSGLGSEYPSYVSGHAGLAFFVAMIGIFLDPQRKNLWFGIGVFYWGLISFTRVAEGGHYLSDVLLAGIDVWLLSLVCYFSFVRFWLSRYCKQS